MWKMPQDYHITQLFIGGNKTALNKPIFKNYKEGKSCDIQIKAVIYAPKKILTAICFPTVPSDN